MTSAVKSLTIFSEFYFKDLMDALATLNAATPKSNAIWTIRMIKGRDDTRVDFQVFFFFLHL